MALVTGNSDTLGAVAGLVAIAGIALRQSIGMASDLRELEPDEASWIVIVTRGHHLDKDALQAALETNATYIGMIGSPSKVKRIFRDLLNEGMSRERLAQVHAPIGLDLGAETPDEIALSIAAEMVMIRKKASGAPLKTMHQLLEEEVPVEH